MEPVVVIDRAELTADPSARLWALVFYLAEHPDEQRRLEFRPFWLAYNYDAQVLNGGHLQYFHNCGSSDVVPTLEALRGVGAIGRANLLLGCWSQVKRVPIEPVRSLQDYSVLAAQRSFAAEDIAYYAERPELLTLLESHYEALLVEAVAVGAQPVASSDGFAAR